VLCLRPDLLYCMTLSIELRGRVNQICKVFGNSASEPDLDCWRTTSYTMTAIRKTVDVFEKKFS
jgi:hypothetical protein